MTGLISICTAIFNYLQLLRVHHWVKNFFIFFPLFFSGQVYDSSKLLNTLLVSLLFSFLTSTVYILNDIMDLEHDRLHEEKRKRPLASGVVFVKEAFLVAGFILLFTLPVVWYWFGPRILLFFSMYWVMNILYSLRLKHVPIIDIAIIAIGFILRIIIGGVVTGITLSKWLVIMTFLLAVFLALAKRRDDLLILKKDGKIMRKSLHGYNMDFINFSMIMTAGIIVVSYIMYSISEEVTQRVKTEFFYFTGLFVVLGVLRYMQIAFVEEKSSSPTRILLTDTFTIVNLLCWAASVFYFIYLH